MPNLHEHQKRGFRKQRYITLALWHHQPPQPIDIKTNQARRWTCIFPGVTYTAYQTEMTEVVIESRQEDFRCGYTPTKEGELSDYVTEHPNSAPTCCGSYRF